MEMRMKNDTSIMIANIGTHLTPFYAEFVIFTGLFVSLWNVLSTGKNQFIVYCSLQIYISLLAAHIIYHWGSHLAKFIFRGELQNTLLCMPITSPYFIVWNVLSSSSLHMVSRNL